MMSRQKLERDRAGGRFETGAPMRGRGRGSESACRGWARREAARHGWVGTAKGFVVLVWVEELFEAATLVLGSSAPREQGCGFRGKVGPMRVPRRCGG